MHTLQLWIFRNLPRKNPINCKCGYNNGVWVKKISCQCWLRLDFVVLSRCLSPMKMFVAWFLHSYWECCALMWPLRIVWSAKPLTAIATNLFELILSLGDIGFECAFGMMSNGFDDGGGSVQHKSHICESPIQHHNKWSTLNNFYLFSYWKHLHFSFLFCSCMAGCM